MRRVKQNLEDIARLLDSDDELPDSYEETMITPAYLNDSRFHHIELPWLNNCKPVRVSQKKAEQTSSQKNLEKTATPTETAQVKEVNNNGRSKIVISKGVLTKRDLFFVKSIEKYCTESTLLWFIESLKIKATTNKTRRSCLAMDYCLNDYKTIKLESFDSQKANYYLKVKYV